MKIYDINYKLARESDGKVYIYSHYVGYKFKLECNSQWYNETKNTINIERMKNDEGVATVNINYDIYTYTIKNNPGIKNAIKVFIKNEVKKIEYKNWFINMYGFNSEKVIYKNSMEEVKKDYPDKNYADLKYLPSGLIVVLEN